MKDLKKILVVSVLFAVSGGLMISQLVYAQETSFAQAQYEQFERLDTELNLFPGRKVAEPRSIQKKEIVKWADQKDASEFDSEVRNFLEVPELRLPEPAVYSEERALGETNGAVVQQTASENTVLGVEAVVPASEMAPPQ